MVTENRQLPLGVLVVLPIVTLQLSAPSCWADKVVDTTGSMRIDVVDSVGKPIPKAAIHVAVWTDEAFDHNRDYTTDAAGRAEVELPKTLSILRIWAKRDGHVPLFANWWPEHDGTAFPLPEEFTFRLAKGSVIGGLVKNDDGQPIAGAKVEVRHVDRANDMKDRPIISTWLAFGDAARTTDANGRWTLDNVPADAEAQVSLKISHPDYINDQSWGEMQSKQNVAIEELRAKTAVVVMQRGIRVAGTVTDPSGKPVSDAVVVYGDDPYSQEGSQEVRTGEDGQYRFPPLPAGPINVTVMAEGWMPQRRKIEITPDNPPVDFKLRPGKMLRLRFVDRAGKPIPDVIVQIAQWRGGESLYNYKHPNVLDTKIPRVADERGIYEWSWAPDDAVSYHIFPPKGNAIVAAPVSIVADGIEKIFPIPLQLAVSGSVTDAETGEAIGQFTAVPMVETADGRLLADRHAAGGFVNRYVLSMHYGSPAYRVRIEAPGYRSAISDASFRFGDTRTACNVALHRAPPAAGYVLTRDGKPLAGALVLLATPSQPLRIVQRYEGKSDMPIFNDEVDSRRTEDDGGFAFPAQCEPYLVVATHERGYAECVRGPDEAPGDMVLSEFARVEVRLRDDDRPAVGGELRLRPLRVQSRLLPAADENFVARSDDDGRFVFDRVPPLKCTLSFARPASTPGLIASTEFVPVDLQPGQSSTIDLGGGREVRGQVAIAGEREIDLSCSLNYLICKNRGIKPPVEVAIERFDWQKGWDESWISTPKGQAYLRTLHHYRANLNSDGTFRIGGVPSGDCEIAFHVYQRTAGRQVTSVATKTVRFNVPAAESETVDLGKIEIAPATEAHPGSVSESEMELLDAGDAGSIRALP
ncbi:MAG TPA: carboxypeptidase-like regulatory domain-containing protein [Pirellulales bacterium]|nr:carboxypeptidase-like regulatory domain-containing protein [Pirellulales bacterium]